MEAPAEEVLVADLQAGPQRPDIEPQLTPRSPLFGHAPALAAIFARLAKAYVPRVANGFVGEIQYDLRRTSGRVTSWTVKGAGDRAFARRGLATAPKLVVRVALADFLRMAAGQVNQRELLKGRRVDLEGDGLLAARLGSLFGRPAPTDIYVAPPTVDPPVLTTSSDLVEA